MQCLEAFFSSGRPIACEGGLLPPTICSVPYVSAIMCVALFEGDCDMRCRLVTRTAVVGSALNAFDAAGKSFRWKGVCRMRPNSHGLIAAAMFLILLSD